MLVLSRKEGQRIMIGEDIEVLVVKAMPGHVKLGITAPPNVMIHRAELGGHITRCLPADSGARERTVPKSPPGTQT